MKKFLILLVCVFTGLAVVDAEARVTTATPKVVGGCEVVGHRTGSLATNAIDTLIVRGINPDYVRTAAAAGDSTAATTEWGFPFVVSFEGLAGTGGAGTTDTLDVAVDISWDGRNWLQRVALAGGAGRCTNAAPHYRGFLWNNAQSVVPFPYVRLRLKNLGAATGPMGVSLTYGAK